VEAAVACKGYCTDLGECLGLKREWVWWGGGAGGGQAGWQLLCGRRIGAEAGGRWIGKPGLEEPRGGQPASDGTPSESISKWSVGSRASRKGGGQMVKRNYKSR
jgi:hypothetical protein